MLARLVSLGDMLGFCSPVAYDQVDRDLSSRSPLVAGIVPRDTGVFDNSVERLQHHELAQDPLSGDTACWSSVSAIRAWLRCPQRSGQS